jgi:hypothetical protein
MAGAGPNVYRIPAVIDTGRMEFADLHQGIAPGLLCSVHHLCPMASYFLPDEEGNTSRPDLFNVLGILTFINSGVFVLIYGIGALGMAAVAQTPVEEFIALVHESAGAYLQADQLEQMDGVIRILHAHGVALMGIYLVRTLLRLIGAIGIWQGRRSGFHLYAGAQLLGLFAPHIILPWALLGFFGPLMTVAITALYGSQYKRLG